MAFLKSLTKIKYFRTSPHHRKIFDITPLLSYEVRALEMGFSLTLPYTKDLIL